MRCRSFSIEITDAAKSLGLLIDSKLTWENHVRKVIKSFAAQLCMLKRVGYLPVKQQEDIYFKMILPNVFYSLLIWGICSTALFEKVEALHI